MTGRGKASIPLSRTYVCPSCRSQSLLHRPPLTSNQHSSRSFSINIAHQAKYTLLSNKRLIRLAGPDATNFLHDLIPAKILGVGTDPIYTAFLTAHGRIISDAFIYPPSWSSGSSESGTIGQAHKAKDFEWWIEADEVGQDILAKHFRKHKLRAKFALEKIKPATMQIMYEWPSEAMSPSSPKTPVGWKAGGKDPRPGMGHRFIIDSDRLPDAFSALGAQEASLEDYTVHRMLNGLAEGHSEIISGHALPQESNIDIVGGIDFHKGCYLGQELTIRTHHTGVVRKRILPCQIYSESASLPEAQWAPAYDPDASLELPPPESNISKASSRRKGRSTGKWLGGVGNIGLALCRLEMMTDIQLTADTTNYDPNEEYMVQWATGEEGADSREVRLKPFVPVWLRHGIEQNLKRKEKKPPKPRDEDGEEDDVD